VTDDADADKTQPNGVKKSKHTNHKISRVPTQKQSVSWYLVSSVGVKVGGDVGGRLLFCPTIFVFWAPRLARTCFLLRRSQSSAVVGPASGRDGQQGQNATNDKARGNGDKARDKEGQNIKHHT
jgi:hypothetical protein